MMETHEGGSKKQPPGNNMFSVSLHLQSQLGGHRAWSMGAAS